MTHVRLETIIEAPIEDVFDLARDIDLHARSMAHTDERAVAGRTSGRIDLGETVTWRARHFGITWSLTSRITVVERPTRFVDEQVAGPFRSFRHEHRFEPIPGGTRSSTIGSTSRRSGSLGRLVDRAILARYMRGSARDAQRGAEGRGRGRGYGQVVGSGMNGPSAVETATNSGSP